MEQAERIVVVGAGQAGAELCSELRRQGYRGSLSLIGEEAWLPYKRPPLSKAYLSGSMTEEALCVLSAAALQRQGIEFLGGMRVNRIDRAHRHIELADGRRIGYHKLALTTGGRARLLSVPGAELPNVHLLRTIADVQALRPRMIPAHRLVIVGGGFIGLEAAAVAVQQGLQVTVLEGVDRVLARATAPLVSRFYERIHREAGVQVLVGAQVQAFTGKDRANAVQLQDGRVLPADCILVGVGLIPNVELAQDAGLEVDNGIVVDEYALSSDPDIVSAGDCANHPSDYAGRRLRLESVQNALEQARVAAHTLLGRRQVYRSVPWFWSDQYDLKLQMVGLSGGQDALVVRGDPERNRDFAVFYLRQGRLIAADTVNRPQEFLIARQLVAAGVTPDSLRLADESQPLKTLLGGLQPMASANLPLLA